MPQSKSRIVPLFPHLQIVSSVNPKKSVLTEESQAVVKFLRDYLERAECGKVLGVCITSANADHTFDAEAAGSYDTFPTAAIGPVEVLKLKLTRRALDDI